MEANHTPGPWSLPHFAQPDINCECRYVLADGYMGAVASVYCSGEGDDWQKHGDNPKFAEAVANAHLIAAAPDMLAALYGLTKLVILVRHRDDCPIGVKTALADHYAMDDAFAAISKASGAQP